MQWKKTIRWTLAALALVLVIVVGGSYLFLRSTAFQNFALRKIEAEANQATGGRTHISKLDFTLSTLTAHLYGIVVRGTERAADPPLLRVDELTVGLKIQSALHRKVNLRELLIQRPVVHLQVDRQGKNNIPQPPPSKSQGNTNVFDLAVGHLALVNGEVDYNDKKIPVDASLYDLETDIKFDSLAVGYYGTISYDQGQLHYAQYAPLSHHFEAKFNATPALFTLESALMKVGSSTASLRANVSNYSNPTVAGDYEIHVHSQDFAAMSPSARPSGDVALTGTIRYQNKQNEPFLRSLAIVGQLASGGLSAVTPNGHVEIRKLKGNYQLANRSLRAQGIAVETLGGRIDADADIRNLDTTPSSHVRASIHNISLQAMQQTVRGAKLKQVAVSGVVNGSLEASWTETVSKIHAQTDLTVRAAAKGTNGNSANVPVNGAIHASYDGPRNILTVRQSTLSVPSTTLTADGQVSNHSTLQLHAQANDLHQLVALASSFGAMQSPPPLSGTATLDVTVQGSMQSPQIVGRLNAENLHVQGSDWRNAGLSVSANPHQILVSNGVLINAKRGRASFSATVPLRDWSYSPNDRVRVSLAVQQMAIADLQHLAGAHYPVSGDLSANFTVNGSQLDPAGSGSAQITNARAYDEPVQTLNLTVQAANGSIVSTLKVAIAAGSAQTDLTYTPKTKAYKLRLDAPSIVLQKLRTLQAKNVQMNGTLSASASGEGTLDDPQLTAMVQLPKLEMQQKSIAGLKAELHVAQKRANLTVDSQVAQAALRARAQLQLTGDYETDASVDTSAIPLDGLLASFGSTVPEGFQGQTELHAVLKGPLKDQNRLEAHLTIPTFNASYQQLQIGAAGPIRADYAHSVVTLQPAEIRGTGSSFHMQGNIPLAGTSTPNFSAQGSVDVRILRIFAPDVDSSGIVAIDIHGAKSSSGPSIQGQVRLQNIALSSNAAPLGVENLNGSLDLGSDRVQISNMNGQVGGGQVSVGGAVVYRPGLQFNIAMKGANVRLRYPEGLRAVLDSNLALTGNMQTSTLNGRVLIDSLSFTPDFDLSSFGDQFSSNAATPSQPGFADTVQLGINVQSQGNLSATSSQVSVEGHVNLNVSGTGANPVITGRTDLTAGELFYRNLRYQLQHSIVTFENPNRTSPNLNLSVSTKVQQYDVTVKMRGPMDKLMLSYSSDPPLASADIIHLIAFGKTTSESAAASGSQSTDSMVASGAQSLVGSGVSSGVQKFAGISSLQIDPLIAGNSQNPSARIALQQRLTKNFFFTFSTDVSQPGAEMVQGEYQINKRWSVSMSRDQLGGVSVDGRFHQKF